MKKILMLVISMLTFNCFGSFFEKKNFNLAIGLQASSLLYKRGIITYQGYQILPIYSISIFNPNLILAGTALYYRQQLSENLFLRSRLNFDATGDEPLYFTTEDEDERVRRESTTELDLYLEYVSTDQSYIRLQISQDLSAHEGKYFEVRVRKALFGFLFQGKDRPLIQPALFSSIGYGTQEHNEYLYGPKVNSGINNFEVGLSVGSPQVIDVFWPTLKISHFQILGTQNRNATFVQEKKGYAVELLFAFAL